MSNVDLQGGLGDSELKRIKERLRDATAHKECHTMADVIDGGLKVGSLEDWNNNPFLNLFRKKYTAISDPNAGLIDLASRVLEAKRPDAIGRMTCNIHETTQDSVKIRVRSKGKAVKTERGTMSIHSYQGRNTYVHITPDDEIEASDEWDRKDLEDSEWNIESEAIESLAMDLKELETEIILQKFGGTDEDNGSAGNITKADNAALTSDLLIGAWNLVKTKNMNPDICFMHPSKLADLLKDDDFKDTTLLGEFADYRQGMIGNFLGMQIYVSSLASSSGDVFVADSARAIQYVVRRDSLIVPYEMPPHRFGVSISTR